MRALVGEAIAVLMLAACGPGKASPNPETGESSGLRPVQSIAPTPIPTPTGPGYGGWIFDPRDQSILYIYLVNPSQEAAEAQALVHLGTERLGSVRKIRPMPAKYSSKQLEQWRRRMQDSPRVREIREPHFTGVGLLLGADPKVFSSYLNRNRITVGVPTEAALARLQASMWPELERLGVPWDAVAFGVEPNPIYYSRQTRPRE